MPILGPLLALAGPIGSLITGALGNKAAAPAPPPPPPPENPFNEAAIARVVDQVANGVKAKLASESGA